MHLAVAWETHCSPSGPHCTPNGKSHTPRNAFCSERHDCPCSRARHSPQEPHCPCCFAGVIIMLRALPLHFIRETNAAQRALCDLVKGSFTRSLCVIVTPAFQTCESKVFSSSPGALGPSWRLELLHGLVVVARQASGIARSSAGPEVPRNTRVPQPRQLGDDVQILADADVALATALDRRVVGRACDGVVILGRGANRVIWAHFVLCHLCCW